MALGAGFADSGFEVRERGRGGGGGGGRGADSAAFVVVVTVVVIGGSDTCDELDALAVPSTSHCPGEPSPGEPLFIGGRASSGGTLGGAVRGGGGCGDGVVVEVEGMDGGDFEGGGTAEAFPWLEAERR